MKTKKAVLILTGLLFCLDACKKVDNITDPGSIVGRWNVVNIETSSVNHAGQPGDYFLFTSDGALTTKEGAILDTWSYIMTTDSTITIIPPASSYALSEFGRITTFTAHSLVINGPYPITPGGPIDEGSSISLSR
jgi:hypothetical protein